MDFIDRQILELANEQWRDADAKESAMEELFDLKPAAFQARVNALIDDPDVILTWPRLVRPLRRRQGRTLELGRTG